MEACRRHRQAGGGGEGLITHGGGTMEAVWECNYTTNYIDTTNLSFLEGPPPKGTPCCHFATQSFLSSISLVESSLPIKILLFL